MEKVFRIDTPHGDYYTLTETEMRETFTNDEIEAFKNDDEVFFYETHYTPRQLYRARKLRWDEDWCYKYEQEYNVAPSVMDILEHLYG